LDIQPEGQLEENKPCSGARKTRRSSLKEPMRRESSLEDAGKASHRVGPSSRTSREELEGEDNDETRQIVAPADQVLTSSGDGELETPSSETCLMKESREMEGEIIERTAKAKDKPMELKSVEAADKIMKKESGDETTESTASPRELRRRKTAKDSPLAASKLKTAVKAEDTVQLDSKEEKTETRTRAGKSQQGEIEQGRGVASKRKAAADDDSTTNESPALRTRLRGHAEDGESVSPLRETRQGPKKLCQNVKADRPAAKKGDKEKTETKKEPSQDSAGLSGEHLGKKETRLEPSSTAAESERTAAAVGRETRRSEMLSTAAAAVVQETRQSELISPAVGRETRQSEVLSSATSAAVVRETRQSETQSSATAAVVWETRASELSLPAAAAVVETREIEMLSKGGAALSCETKESTVLSLSTGTSSEVRETRQRVAAAADSSQVEGPSLRLR